MTNIRIVCGVVGIVLMNDEAEFMADPNPFMINFEFGTVKADRLLIFSRGWHAFTYL